MADLFAGTYNFVPAFEGQRIANQTGAGAAQAFVGGVNAGAASRNAQTNEKKAGIGNDNNPNGMLGFSSWLQGVLGN